MSNVKISAKLIDRKPKGYPVKDFFGVRKAFQSLE